MAVVDDGDDIPSLRRRRSPSGLRRVKHLREIQNENIEEHEREPRRAKITETEPHRHLEDRERYAWSVEALARTKVALPEKKWLCFLAVEFGMVQDGRGILRVHRALLNPAMKERDLTFEEVAQHYAVSVETVKQYDREARRTYQDLRERVEHEPKHSYWWGDEYGHM